MGKPLDDNDRLRNGTLPLDPEEDGVEVVAANRPITDGLWSGTIRALSPDMLDPSKPPPPTPFLLLRDPEEGERAFRGVFPMGRVGMLSAGGGVGKTFVLAQLVTAVATGTRFLDAWQTRTDGNGLVLFIVGEEEIDEVHRRLWYIADAYGYDAQDRARILDRVRVAACAGLAITFTDESGRRTTTFADLRKLLDSEPRGWSLVVIDPLARVAGQGAEIDNALGTAFVATLEALTKAPGKPAVLVAHHTSEAARQSGRLDATASRGVTALTDGIRWQATLVNNEETGLLTLHVGKSNYAAIPPDLTLVRADHGVLRLADPERLAEENIGPAAGGATAARTWLRQYVVANPGCTTARWLEAARKVNGGPGFRTSTLNAARDELREDGELISVRDGRRELWHVRDPDTEEP